MVLKFKDNNNITRVSDNSSLGAIRFSSLEDQKNMETGIQPEISEKKIVLLD
ncbi:MULTISPECIES: hypothetical protein [unclassified Enterococcus]|uniref:hypothetical protein n=1 Tax=unclassified Enterococcus TaxID=2608891 RepID=UPI001F1F9AEE|nr:MULTISPECIES: hypothetical protein [unclassified Enterococcus]